MKSLFLLPMILFLNLTDSNLKCSDFKVGRFELINTQTNRKYIIERNAEFQTEVTYDLKSGEKISGPAFYKIKWLSECEYNLLLDTAKSSYDENDLYVNSKGGLKTKILKINANCSTVVTTFEDVRIEAKICKIK
jgi:hypothetical protein